MALTVAAGARAEEREWESKDEGQVKEKKEIRIYRGNEEETADQKGGYLGVQVQDISRALKRARDLTTDSGALVNRVEDESPADEAGIRHGDVIVSVDGKEIEDSGELIEVVRSLEPGRDVRVVVLRGDERKTFKVELGERPKNQIGIAPDFPRRWRDPEGIRNVPVPPGGPRPPTGLREERIERIEGLGESLRELREQLRVLRETEIPRLEEELRLLREELRRMGTGDDEDRNEIRREGRRSRTPAEE